MKSLFVYTIALICSLSLIPAVAHAQVGNSSLSGVVKDPQGAVIPKAQVAIHSADEAFVRSAATGADGTYVIPTLPPGTYRLVVSAPGFATLETQPFELSSEQVGALNVTLKVASQGTQVVVVQSTPPLLQTTSASVATVFSARTLSSIPLLGRSFLNALDLAPGVIPLPPAGSTTNYSPVSQSTMPSVFGQRQKDNNFLIDGVENRDANLLGVTIYPPPDAIREMTIDSGVGSSAFGHASGATIDVVTKSGTSTWHGDTWEYWRNNILDAVTFPALTVGSYHWNQFGAAAGGPLVLPWLLSQQRKWYVYGWYEGVRITQPADFTDYVPTTAQLAGNFTGFAPIYNPFSTTGSSGAYSRPQFLNNQIPSSMLNPTALKMAAVFPAPNLAAGVIPGSNYLNTAGDTTGGNQWSVRVDHQFGQRDSFFARYTAAYNPSTGVSYPEVGSVTTEHLTNIEASDTHVISKSFVVTIRYGLSGVHYFTGNTFPGGYIASTGLGSVFPTFLGNAIVPTTDISGYAGIPYNNTTIGPVDQNSGIVDAQKVTGEHTIEFGGNIVYTHNVIAQLVNTNLSFLTAETSDFNSTTGDGMASFLLGVPDSAARQIGGTVADLTTYAYGLYAQDTWRHRRLTLNGGLRYDYAAPPVNSQGLGGLDYGTGIYIFDKKNPVTGAAANIRPGGRPPARNNFAPRFGLAYQISPRTVVRASAGVFFDTFGSNYIQASESALGNWPFSYPQTVTGLNATTITSQLPNPFPGSPVGSPTPSAACSQCLDVDKNSSRTPYVGEWTLSIQRQIGSNLSVEGSYFGSKGTKLTSQVITNTATPGSADYTARLPYPQYAPYIMDGYNEWPSWYNAGVLRVQRRYSRGLSFLLAYTYSKNIDYIDNLSSGNVYGQVTSNPTLFNGPLNKGLAGFDLRQVVVLSNVWNIPGRTQNRILDEIVAGWSLSNIFSYHSGLPYSVFLSTDNENTGALSTGRFTELPNQVGNPNAVQRNVYEWFNTSAFAVPPSGTVGNMHRNIPSLKSGTYTDDDLAAGKTWAIHEPVSFELRGEFFNLFNHANFAPPGQLLGTAQFGTVSSTVNSGRTVQLVAKIHF